MKEILSLRPQSLTQRSCHRDFGDQVQELLGPLRSKAEPAKVVLVAATLTKVGSMS